MSTLIQSPLLKRRIRKEFKDADQRFVEAAIDKLNALWMAIPVDKVAESTATIVPIPGVDSGKAVPTYDVASINSRDKYFKYARDRFNIDKSYEDELNQIKIATNLTVAEKKDAIFKLEKEHQKLLAESS